jgi:hypothetical protein
MKAPMRTLDPDIELAPSRQIGKPFEDRVPGSDLAIGCDFGEDSITMGAQHWTGRDLHGMWGKVFGNGNTASCVEDLASRGNSQRRGNPAAIGVPRDAAPDKTMTKKAQARQKCLRWQVWMIF